MDDFDRYQVEKAAALLDSWLRSGVTDKPSQLMLDAIHMAVKQMRKLDDVRVVPLYKRNCAVLAYHITNPTAVLFRDPVTINAIKTGIAVLERALQRQE